MNKINQLHRNEYMREWRRKGGSDYKAAYNEYVRGWRKAKKAAGMCGVCGIKPLLTSSYCVECLEKKRQHRLNTGRATDKAWKVANPDRVRAHRLTRKQKIRAAVLEAYGGRCSCCGEDEPLLMTVDHVYGWQAVPESPRHGGRLWEWVYLQNFPASFGLLCFGCNWAKGRYGLCPHQLRGLS